MNQSQVIPEIIETVERIDGGDPPEATAKETPSSGSERRPCSPSSGEDSVWHAEYLKASDRAIRMEIERNDARRDRDEWKASSEQYHRANASLDKAWSEMLALLRRIARKGEFMDREGLRLVVSDWLARRHLLQENAGLSHGDESER